MKIVIEISEGTYSAVVSDYWCGDPIFRQAIINGQIIPTYNIKPCSNAIDRAEAIRVASGYCYFTNIAKELAKLPPVTPEPKVGRWIPCSERLPERTGEYLVSVIDDSGEDDDYEAVGVSWFAHKKDYDIKESEWRDLGIDETVIAWMPLPKPYEPQESEVEE